MSIIKSSLHNHTTLCDGAATPDELILAAIDEGLSDIGISGHGYTPFDVDYSIKNEDEYVDTVLACRNKYRDRIRVWCGIEQDFLAPCRDLSRFDYVIGSVHYMKASGTDLYFPFDASCEKTLFLRDELFGGDGYALCKEYYRLVAENALKYKPDIIGHFDLITKYNGDGLMFDEDDKRYRNAALESLDACAETDGIFEVNCGAIRRGARKIPYPAPFLLKRILELSAKVILTSDCHQKDGLCYGFENAAEILREVGFSSVLVFENGRFVEVGI